MISTKAMFAVAAALAIGSAAHAAPNLITNPGFDATSTSETNYFYGAGNYNVDAATGWKLGGYGLYIFAGTATSANVGNVPGFRLWGNPDNTPGAPGSVANGYVDSPSGGNYLGLDGDTTPGVQGTVTQTLYGLTAGTYRISFDWAAAQQTDQTGPTTESVIVNFGGQSQQTSYVSNASKGFVPWQRQSFDFYTAGGDTVLQFVASGTPAGLPPFVLLDGLNASAVPEPATWAMMIVGMGLVGMSLRRRKAAMA
jgi:hypothetical protein